MLSVIFIQISINSLEMILVLHMQMSKNAIHLRIILAYTLKKTKTITLIPNPQPNSPYSTDEFPSIYCFEVSFILRILSISHFREHRPFSKTSVLPKSGRAMSF